ncbi:hypothetical protein [Arthrobacter woluwensis]|uniref:hypothetical protein n=1 Tax=Arthrobacter woluwensis TaxID=156980 RepID=UPI001AAF7D72|nr:hypothetical protein [Arthrobacter woluwensis]QTF73369.1 hypothetical protein G8758_16160 [Arthrobacter woluwensis]
MSDKDRTVLEKTVDRVGAIVMDSRSFEKNEGEGRWANAGPMGEIPCFIVTHHRPSREYAPVSTFVSDGVGRAIRQAQHAAAGMELHLFDAAARKP